MEREIFDPIVAHFDLSYSCHSQLIENKKKKKEGKGGGGGGGGWFCSIGPP